MQHILLLSSLVFAIAALGFYFRKSKKSNLPFLVSSITIVSSLVMLEGSLIPLNSSGEGLYWTRWAFYTISCTVLMYSIVEYLKLEAKRAEMLYLTAFVMITGAFASALSGWAMYSFFILGGAFYCILLKHIYSSKKKKELAIVSPFILLGWTGFPIVFLLAPEGLGFITNMAAASMYLLLDIYTKIYFYIRIKK